MARLSLVLSVLAKCSPMSIGELQERTGFDINQLREVIREGIHKGYISGDIKNYRRY